jgi:hypothetical protein
MTNNFSDQVHHPVKRASGEHCMLFIVNEEKRHAGTKLKSKWPIPNYNSRASSVF